MAPFSPRYLGFLTLLIHHLLRPCHAVLGPEHLLSDTNLDRLATRAGRFPQRTSLMQRVEAQGPTAGPPTDLQRLGVGPDFSHAEVRESISHQDHKLARTPAPLPPLHVLHKRPDMFSLMPSRPPGGPPSPSPSPPRSRSPSPSALPLPTREHSPSHSPPPPLPPSSPRSRSPSPPARAPTLPDSPHPFHSPPRDAHSPPSSPRLNGAYIRAPRPTSPISPTSPPHTPHRSPSPPPIPGSSPLVSRPQITSLATHTAAYAMEMQDRKNREMRRTAAHTLLAGEPLTAAQQRRAVRKYGKEGRQEVRKVVRYCGLLVNGQEGGRPGREILGRYLGWRDACREVEEGVGKRGR